MSLLASIICFIVCHGGPADHFSTFSEELQKKGYNIQIYATGAALKKFQERHIEKVIPFSLKEDSDEQLAIQLAQCCSQATIVITDVGHPFDITLQNAFREYAPQVFRFAYYDNPEPYVPGGYSLIAAQVMNRAQGALFANANLAKSAIYQAPKQEIPLAYEQRVGLGFYPFDHVEKISKRRIEEHNLLRTRFFSERNLKDQGQKILVYVGGNNEEYFSKAFPTFLHFLEAMSQKMDPTHFLFLLQQHPGAKEKNIDAKLVQKWKVQSTNGALPLFISDLHSDDAQVLADAILYYQTSMAPQFILAGIPTIQVGHEPYADILVKNKLCLVANSEEKLLDACNSIQHTTAQESMEVIKKALGINPDWIATLEKAIKETN